MRWRFRFTALTALATWVLMGWGAFVTSIEAGLAVPDWPSSYSSWDPLNPWPGWWRVTPLLAEHGHRLLGMAVGMLTVALAIWTWIAESRRWLRWLSLGAAALVSFQGLLGGLRVVWLSLDLAVVHASVAQLFLALVAGMALFTSPAWLRGDAPAPGLHRPTLFLAVAIWGQILLGALLRHPGTGLDPLLATVHIGGALVVLFGALALFRCTPRSAPVVSPASRLLAVLVVVQAFLGLFAWLVTLDDAGMLVPSNLQVVLNTSHASLGAILMAIGAVAALAAWRFREAS